MSTTATFDPIKVKEAQDKGRATIFELTNRSKSQWVKKGTQHSPNPRHLNAPREYTLPIRSRLYRGEGKGYAETQYVPGADTIFVDDVKDAKGLVIQKGLRNQGYDLRQEYERATNLGIKFVFGLLDLKKYGDDPRLLEFLNNHEDNLESPTNTTKGGKDPRKIQSFNFAPLRKEEKAKKAIEMLEDDAAALEFLTKLRKKKDGEYTYNTDVINAVCHIFEIHQAYMDGAPAQKVEALIQLAKRNGAGFINAIRDTVDEYRMSIGVAQQYGVLHITSKDAKLQTATDVAVIKELSGEGRDENIEELIYFFIGDDKGKQNYSLMCGETDVRKAESLRNK